MQMESTDEEHPGVVYNAKVNELGCRDFRIKKPFHNADQYQSTFTPNESKEYLKKFTTHLRNRDMKGAMFLARELVDEFLPIQYHEDVDFSKMQSCADSNQGRIHMLLEVDI